MKPEIRKIHRNNRYSYVLTVPKSFIRELNWSSGEFVAFHMRGKTVVMERINFMESK